MNCRNIYLKINYCISMMLKKHLALVMLLAVYRCFSSAPLSLIQGHLEGIYYFRMAMSPKIIPWDSSQTSKVQFEIVNRYGHIRFTAIVKETINCLNGFLDDLNKNISGDPGNHRGFFRDRSLNLNTVNNCGTYEIYKRGFLVVI